LTFVVEITDLALAEAADYVHFIREAKKEPQSAEEWFRALLAAIFSLEEQPERCPLIPERHDFGVEIRHLIYFSHRIIFSVDHHGKYVTVQRIYHGSRKRLKAGDIGRS
jgi:plasmid stabilization system protein ParE